MPGALIELPGLSRRYVTGVDGRVTFEIRRTTTVVEVAMAIDAVVLLAEFYEPGRVPDRFGGTSISVASSCSGPAAWPGGKASLEDRVDAARLPLLRVRLLERFRKLLQLPLHHRLERHQRVVVGEGDVCDKLAAGHRIGS